MKSFKQFLKENNIIPFPSSSTNMSRLARNVPKKRTGDELKELLNHDPNGDHKKEDEKYYAAYNMMENNPHLISIKHFKQAMEHPYDDIAETAIRHVPEFTEKHREIAKTHSNIYVRHMADDRYHRRGEFIEKDQK